MANSFDSGQKSVLSATETNTPSAPISQKKLSQRSRIDPFIVMDVMRLANEKQAAGDDIIHMEVGQPGTPAPRLVREAAARALAEDKLGYTDALGLPALRARIAAFYRTRYGLSVPPERVVVTTGSSAGFVLAFLAAFDAGAKVALPTPGYPCYRHILKALDMDAVLFPLDEASGWLPTAAQLEALVTKDGIQGLLLASPANPTGTMLTSQALRELVATCRRHGLWFFSDEIYHGLTYEAEAETALAHWDDAVVINSFSKYFSMTGWRIGWMVVPEAWVRPMERLMQNLYISAPTLSQLAAIAAFDAEAELESYKAVYAANRELLLNELPAVGFDKILPADGAFYLYVDVGAYTQDSLAFSRRMLEEIGVAVTPGLDFDPLRGHRFLRFSYAGKTEDMAEAIRRLKNWSF